jgi:hypothetical protein
MKITLFLKPWQFTKFLAVVAPCLVIASIVGQIAVYLLPDFPGRDSFATEFNLNEEGNFPSLYSVLTLLFCSVLLGTIAHIKKLDNARFVRHWRALAFIFLYLAVDEGLGLHEHLTEPLQNLGFKGLLYYAWIVPAAILLFVFGLTFLKFLFHLPARTQHLFITAGMIFVGGGLGMELIGGNYDELYGQANLTYQFLTAIEESLEMLGIIIFIHALVSYANRLGLKEVVVQVPVEKYETAPHLENKKQSLKA